MSQVHRASGSEGGQGWGSSLAPGRAITVLALPASGLSTPSSQSACRIMLTDRLATRSRGAPTLPLLEVSGPAAVGADEVGGAYLDGHTWSPLGRARGLG